MARSLFLGSNVEVFIFVKGENRRTRGDVFNCKKLSRLKNASSGRGKFPLGSVKSECEWSDENDKLGPLQRGYLKQRRSFITSSVCLCNNDK